MVETHHPLVERALDVVDEELKIAAAERRAFEVFRSRLSDIDPDPPASHGGATTGGSMAMAVTETDPGSTGRSLMQVRTAYRETVMSVPHFESAYGDTLAGNVAAEFGADLASQVADGRRLTGTLREALLAAAESGIDERETYRRNLRQERESLREVHAGVADCEERAHALAETADGASGSGAVAAVDARFDDLEAECSDLATARQRVIHSRRTTRISGVDEMSLTRLLYGDLETTCPGLAEITRCLETIHDRRRRCLR